MDFNKLSSQSVHIRAIKLSTATLQHHPNKTERRVRRSSWLRENRSLGNYWWCTFAQFLNHYIIQPTWNVPIFCPRRMVPNNVRMGESRQSLHFSNRSLGNYWWCTFAQFLNHYIIQPTWNVPIFCPRRMVPNNVRMGESRQSLHFSNRSLGNYWWCTFAQFLNHYIIQPTWNVPIFCPRRMVPNNVRMGESRQSLHFSQL